MTVKLVFPKTVEICEVGPRDGFQAEKVWIPTEQKVDIIKKLAGTGITSLEITSFVHPKAIPQLKDAEEVVKLTQELTNLKLRALVPNLKGAERAYQSGITSLKLMLSATDSHSLSNANSTVEEAQQKHDPIIEFAGKHGMRVGGAISVVFGCPYEGAVSVEKVSQIVANYYKKGITEVSLADTSGMGNPNQVAIMLDKLIQEHPNVTFSMHLHNTRGMAFANAIVALQKGIIKFDSSIAGLGGCPYAPGATGNIATEDLVHSFEEMGIKTGINLDSIIRVAQDVKTMLGHDGGSYMLQAGPNSKLHMKPTSQVKVSK